MKKELTIFDNPKNVGKFRIFLYITLVLLLVSEFFIHKHHGFAWEDFPGFYAVYGFISYVFLIFVAKILRKIVMRKEDYYDK